MISRPLAIGLLGALVLLGGIGISWLADRESRTVPVPSPDAPAEARATLPLLDVAPGADRVPQAPRPAAETLAPKPAPAPSAGGAPHQGWLLVRLVEKETGASLPGVRVTAGTRVGVNSWTSADSSRGTLDEAPITDADGCAEFELPAGVELTLSVRLEDGFLNRTADVRPLAAGERRDFVFRIPVGDDLHYVGRVLTAGDGLPISGATVEAVHIQSRFLQVGAGPAKPERKEAVLDATTTGGDGFFELRTSSAKRPYVRVRAPGFSMRLLVPGEGHGSLENAEVVLLARCSTLRVTLLDASGSALPDAAVVLSTEPFELAQGLGSLEATASFLQSSASEEISRWESSTDSLGRCEVVDLPAGVVLQTRVSREGRELKRDVLTLDPGETREVVWRLGSGCRLEGTVVDQEGRPVAKKRVWMLRDELDREPRYFEGLEDVDVLEARTDDEGRFEFTDLATGSWRIGPAVDREPWDPPRESALAPWSEPLEIAEGEVRRSLVLRVHRGLYVRGKVLDPSGLPTAEAQVLGFQDGQGSVSTETQEDGTFALGPLVPGRYHVWASDFRGQQAGSEPVIAESGQAGVVLRLTAGSSLAGQVVDAGGTGVRGARVHVSAAPASFVSATSTDDDGRFRFDGMPPGTYAVAATAGGMRAGLVTGIPVAEGAVRDDVVVGLGDGAELRLSGADGDWIGGTLWIGDVAVGSFRASAGATCTVTVPPGRLRILVWIGEAAMTSREVPVAAGERAEVVLGGD